MDAKNKFMFNDRCALGSAEKSKGRRLLSLSSYFCLDPTQPIPAQLTTLNRNEETGGRFVQQLILER